MGAALLDKGLSGEGLSILTPKATHHPIGEGDKEA